MTNLTNVSKFENKLRKIIQMNEKGSIVYTNKTSESLAFGLSKSEVLDAFKADVEETAKDLINNLPVINSVKGGIVHELKTLDNSVEIFFGNTYNKEQNTITLSGIIFNLNKNISMKKSEIIDSIYNDVFGVTRKELNVLLKALVKYDASTDALEKTLLYPSIIVADKIIEKMGLIDSIFNEYRSLMTYEEKVDFSAAFNRSGIGEVIQNATFIDKTGVRQSVHNKQGKYISAIAEGIKNNTFKYIEAVEIDGDGDCDKVLRVINQIERLKINCEYKFTLKFRKLGNYKANGLFHPIGLIVAEDVRNTCALMHEIAHFIHLTNTEIYTSDFVNYMIGKMTKRIDFNNLSVDAEKREILKKQAYYCDPAEVVARMLEIASLFAKEGGKLMMGTDEFNLIKSRLSYEEREGIYFNFKSFDDKTVEEFSKLFEMFYETTFDMVKNTNINNFYKIDTNYKRKNYDSVTSVVDALRIEAKRAEKERKTLYGMVNAENIKLIIDNRARGLSLDTLCTYVLKNLHYCGGHNSSLDAEGWAGVKEDKSKMVLIMLDLIKSSKTDLEYLEFLHDLQKNRVLCVVEQACTVSGFVTKWRMKIKKVLNDTYPDGSFFQFYSFYQSIARNVFRIASDEVINDYEYMKQYIEEDKFFFTSLADKMNDDIAIKHSYDLLERNELRFGAYPKCALKSSEFFKAFSMKNPDVPDIIGYTSDEIKGNTQLMAEALTRIADFNHKNLIIAFNFVDDEIKKDVEFVSHFVKYNKEILELVPAEVRNIILNISVVPKKKEKKEKKESPLSEIKNDSITAYDEKRFEKYLESAIIEDFKHSKSGEDMKVLKIEKKLEKEEFINFNKYLIENGIAYYSRWVKGFVIKNMSKIAVASVTTVLYATETLAVFAEGRLF